MPALLEGVRVLDFGRFIAGPYAAMMLADFGAEVIRIERRDGGEDRWVGPIIESGEGGLFLNINRNKRGMTLDLGRPEARPIVERLVRSADIVVANLPLEVLEKLELDYPALVKLKSDIILVMASAFGSEGPYQHRVGFDGVLQAMSGAMSLTGFEKPVRSIVPWADYGTALHAAFGALGALYHRQQTGQGQLVDVSLLATSMMFMNSLLLERNVTGTVRRRIGNTSFYTAPSDAYATRDGWILVPTIGQAMFRRWTRLVGREDLLSDPRCADDLTRADNAELINDVMSAWCAVRTRAQALEELEQARIPAGPVNELHEAIADPQVVARELLQPHEAPDKSKLLPLAAPPAKLSATPAEVRHGAPALGQHTDEILGELGFTAGEIEAFRAKEIV